MELIIFLTIYILIGIATCVIFDHKGFITTNLERAVTITLYPHIFVLSIIIFFRKRNKEQ